MRRLLQSVIMGAALLAFGLPVAAEAPPQNAPGMATGTYLQPVAIYGPDGKIISTFGGGAGSASTANQGAPGTVPWPVTWTGNLGVTVANFPANQNVTVGNFPATQPVSGSVSVGNFPATQTVGGTVNIGNLPATQPVSGAVAVSNFPTTQPVSGTVSVTPTDGTVPAGAPFTATSAAVLFDIDTSGYESITTQLSGAFVGTALYEVSNDRVNWVAQVGNLAQNVGNSSLGSSDTGPSIRTFPTFARYFRVRVGTYTSGTFTVSPILRSSSVSPGAVYVGGGSITVASGSIVASGVNASNLAGGLTTASRIVASTATTNATIAKASAGRVYKITGYNFGTTLRWLRFYNTASTPAPGTTAAFFAVPVPPGAFSYDAQDLGYYFSTGIGYAITANPADNDNVSITASEVLNLNVWYQ
jgi:hypothetical protein